MTTKKNNIAGKETGKTNLAQTTGVLPIRKNDSFWKGKTIEELIKEQGVKPIKDEEDFTRISGGQEEWDDIDEFLKEVHRPLK